MGRRLFKPEVFLGNLKKKGYFEGWYFKHVGREKKTIALIPGISIEPEHEGHAFIQVLDGYTDETHYVEFPFSDFSASKQELDICIAENRFGISGLELDIDRPELKLKGRVTYSGIVPFPVTLRSPGIMGWYSYLPRMECFHGVVSMRHAVSGSISCNGNTYDLTDGTGYIEKDWGSSFPRDYIWVQSSDFDETDSSFMLSVASIPWMGSEFTGFLSFLNTGNQLYRFATYTRAHIQQLSSTSRSLTLRLYDRSHILTLETQGEEGRELSAPEHGEMKRTIKESVISRIHIELEDSNGNHIYSGEGFPAGFEQAGDISNLFK
jgi:tocopherol cyclase